MKKDNFILGFLIVLTGICFHGCKEGKVRFLHSENYSIVPNYALDDSLEKQIEPYRDSLYQEMKAIVGVTNIAMEKGRPESALGNFVADLCMEEVRLMDVLSDSLPLLALFNNGGLRSSLMKGDISLENVYSLMPFENELVLIKMPGNVVLEMGKYIVQRGGEPFGGFQIIAKKDSLINMLMDGKEIDLNSNYYILTSDYLAKGGDKMSFFAKGGTPIVVNLKIRDAIIQYFQRNMELGNKVSSKKDKRFLYVE